MLESRSLWARRPHQRGPKRETVSQSALAVNPAGHLCFAGRRGEQNMCCCSVWGRSGVISSGHPEKVAVGRGGAWERADVQSDGRSERRWEVGAQGSDLDEIWR